MVIKSSVILQSVGRNVSQAQVCSYTLTIPFTIISRLEGQMPRTTCTSCLYTVRWEAYSLASVTYNSQGLQQCDAGRMLLPFCTLAILLLHVWAFSYVLAQRPQNSIQVAGLISFSSPVQTNATVELMYTRIYRVLMSVFATPLRQQESKGSIKKFNERLNKQIRRFFRTNGGCGLLVHISYFS